MKLHKLTLPKATLKLLAAILLLAVSDAKGGGTDTQDSFTPDSFTEDSFTDTFGEGETRGLLRAVNRAEISAGIDGLIIKLPFKDGDSFQKGDLLIEFDCRRYQASVDIARSKAFLAKKTWETTKTLHARGAASPFEVELSKGEHDAAESELRAGIYLVSQCRIIAPFNGKIANTEARLHENATTNRRLFTIIDNSKLTVDLIVPSFWLKWLTIGTTFTIKVDETGKSYNGRISKLGGEVDPVSHSVKLLGEIIKPGKELIAGMSGAVKLHKQP